MSLPPNSKLQELYQKRQEDLASQDWKSLIETLHQIIALAPTSIHFCNRGDFFFRLGYYQEAIHDWKKALTLSPQSQDLAAKIDQAQKQLQNKVIKEKSLSLKSKNVEQEKREESPSEILFQAPPEIDKLFLLESEGRKNFGRYEIQRVLGQGGMGKVYQAFDPHLKRDLALKVITGRSTGTEQLIQRFLQEAQSIATINHPNVIQVYDIGEEEGTSFFTMEYLTGRNLSQLIREEDLSYQKIMELLLKVTSGVQEAHRHGIIHRDLKPGNIMFDEEREPRVMDFGLAKIVENETELSKSGMILGTPAYMSPEQARGEINKIDERSDIYSLGAVLYEMVTKSPPFRGDSNMQIIIQVLDKEPISPRYLNPDIPIEMEAISLKCLEKNPLKRYQTSEELRKDIENFLAYRPIRAKPPGILGRTQKWCQRYPLASVFLLLTTVSTLLASWLAYQQRTANLFIAQQKENLEQSNQAKDKALLEKGRASVREKIALGKSQNELRQAYLNFAQSEIEKRNFTQAAQTLVQARKYSEQAQNKFEEASSEIRQNKQFSPGDFTQEVREYESGRGKLRQTLRFSVLPNLPQKVAEASWVQKSASFGKIFLGKEDTLFSEYWSDTGFSYRSVKTGDKKVARVFLENEKKAFYLTAKNDLLMATEKELIFLDWKTKEKKVLYSLDIEERVDDLAISPDYRWIALRVSREHLKDTSGDLLRQISRIMNVIFIEVATKTPYHQELFLKKRGLAKVVFSPDSRFLAVNKDRGVEIWNLEKNEKKWEFLHLGVSELAFSPDQTSLVCGDLDGNLLLYSLEKAQDRPQYLSLKAHEKWVNHIEYSPDGNFFATSGHDNRVVLWDANLYEQIWQQELIDICDLIKFDDQGQFLHTCVAREGIFYKKWRVHPLWKKRLPLPKKDLPLFSAVKKSFGRRSVFRSPISWSSQGRFLAFYPFNLATVYLWDTLWDTQRNTQKKSPRTFRSLGDGNVRQAFFSPDEKWLAILHRSRTLRVHSLINEEVYEVRHPASLIRFLQDNATILFSPGDPDRGRLYTFEWRTKVVKALDYIFSGVITALEVSLDGKWVAIGSAETMDIVPFEALFQPPPARSSEFQYFPPETQRISSFGWHPNGNLLATGCTRNTVTVWEKSEEETQPWQHKKTMRFKEPLQQLSFSPQDNKLAIFLENKILIYDCDNDFLTETFLGYFKGNIASLSPDWRLLALPEDKGDISIYEVPQGHGLEKASVKKWQNFVQERSQK